MITLVDVVDVKCCLAVFFSATTSENADKHKQLL